MLKSKRFPIESDDVLRLFPLKKRKSNIANEALNNNIIPFPGLDSVELHSNMWRDTKEEKYGNTHTLYMHSLRVVVELLLAFEDTDDIAYFDKADEIVKMWIKYIENDDDDNKMIWYDHTVASRTQVLIHYLFISNSLNSKYDFNTFKNLLKKQAVILMDDSIYNFNNHGLMMDRSLIVMGHVLNDNEIKFKGKLRATQTYWHSFSFQGIHLENSPQYHKMVTRIYYDIESYLNKKNDSLGVNILKNLELGKVYIPKITRPNYKLTNIGDSGSLTQKLVKSFENVFDVEAGISIIQRRDPNELFVTFIAGYSSRVHKHSDDLSITLNYNRVDFIVDPGKYGYTNNSTRNYINSRKAHSGFYFKDLKYKVNHNNRYSRKVRLENYYENSKYSIIRGIHNDYSDTESTLSRSVVVLKKYDFILLIDEILNVDKENSYELEQCFNLDSNVKVNKNESSFKLSSDDEELTIKQFSNYYNGEIVKGSLSAPIAVNVSGYLKVKKTKQLKFNKKVNTDGVAFLTAIYDSKNINKISVIKNESIIKINISDEEILIYL